MYIEIFQALFDNKEFVKTNMYKETFSDVIYLLVLYLLVFRIDKYNYKS